MLKFLLKEWLILKKINYTDLKDFHFTENNMNFVIFVNKKCLKAISRISAVKIKIFETLFLNICTGLGYFILTEWVLQDFADRFVKTL